MDVDTVPISEEEFAVQSNSNNKDVAALSNAAAQPKSMPPVQQHTSRPARPKPAVKRRR